MRLHGIYVLLATALLVGCSGWEPLPPPQPVPAERVFLMYDNIGMWFDADVNEAGKAVAAGTLDPEERVVVYERMASGNIIYELARDSSKSEGFDKKLRKQYAPGENSTLDTETINRVVGDIRALFPENPAHWGFAFGSHGSGWLPKTASLAPTVGVGGVAAADPFAPLWELYEDRQTRYFVSDRKEKLDVSEFVEALDEWAWDFILLDDCFMSSIESLYRMRTLADYIIASPTEIMDRGFPYGLVVESVFGEWGKAGFVEAGRQFVDYYRRNPTHPYATVAVIETSGLEELAVSVREIIRQGELTPPDATEASKMQTYEGLEVHVFYDFNQYIAYLSQNSPDLYAGFADRLEQMVVYKDHTERYPTAFPSGGGVTSRPISAEHYSGINAFIPTTATARLTGFWEETDWYKDVYGEEIE